MQAVIRQCTDPDEPSPLLRLPWPALDCILQKLDPCSLACVAVTCSRLRHAPTYTSTAVLQCPCQHRLDRFTDWLEERTTSLTTLTQCSFVGPVTPVDASATLSRLPHPQLLELHTQRLKLQLEPAGTLPGVLTSCKGLTALYLKDCRAPDAPTAFAAITALPALQHLELSRTYDADGDFLFWKVSVDYPGRLTSLSLEFGDVQPYSRHLRQLSALVSLQDLRLNGLNSSRLPGGVPSQMVKLTCLHVMYSLDCGDGQFQHLSRLTALQELSVRGSDLDAPDLPGIQHLSKLTSLKLASPTLIFATTGVGGTHSWTQLTALQELDLLGCTVQPEVVAALTHLRVLSLVDVDILRPATNEELMLALSQLTLLSKLKLSSEGLWELEDMPSAAAFTALTASTHLCSLQVGLPAAGILQLSDMFLEHEHSNDVRHTPTVFRHGVMLPHLRVIDLQHNMTSAATPLSEQQLQRLCSCCSAVQNLSFVLDEAASPAACKPLLQLSVLTALQVLGLGAGAPAAAAIDVAAQLTMLRELRLEQVGTFWDTRGQSRVHQQLQTAPVQQLTALTALEQLQLTSRPWVSAAAAMIAGTDHEIGPTAKATQAVVLQLSNKAKPWNPPDVWQQLRDSYMQHILLTASAAAKVHVGLANADAERTKAHSESYGLPMDVHKSHTELAEKAAASTTTTTDGFLYFEDERSSPHYLRHRVLSQQGVYLT